MTTYTPRTDACPHCGAGIYALLGPSDETTYWQCGSEIVREWGVSRSAECYEKELAASKAEVERLKEAMISCLHITNCYDGNYARACDNVELIVRNALK
jgi:hypothetical protein